MTPEGLQPTEQSPEAIAEQSVARVVEGLKMVNELHGQDLPPEIMRNLFAYKDIEAVIAGGGEKYVAMLIEGAKAGNEEHMTALRRIREFVSDDAFKPWLENNQPVNNFLTDLENKIKEAKSKGTTSKWKFWSK